MSPYKKMWILKKVYILCIIGLLFQTIKQDNKEQYRRLLEMVTEKYSKNQPLPFNQTKPKEWGQIHSVYEISSH